MEEPISEKRDQTSLESNPLGGPVQVALLRDQVTEAIRAAIYSMQFLPGQRLLERELIAWTGVSRSTLREAIRQLAVEGLVEVTPQKGATVATPTLDEIVQLYEIRALLEGHALRLYTEVVDADDLRRLKEIVAEFRTTVERGAEPSEILAAKAEFYQVIREHSACATVLDIVNVVQAKIVLEQTTGFTSAVRAKAAVRELEAIVLALENKDGAAAERAAADHIRGAARAAVEIVKGRSSSNNPDEVIQRIVTSTSTSGEQRPPG